MFNTDRPIVSYDTQCGKNIFPVSRIIAITNGPEYPGAINFIAVMFGIQDAVDRGMPLN